MATCASCDMGYGADHVCMGIERVCLIKSKIDNNFENTQQQHNGEIKLGAMTERERERVFGAAHKFSPLCEVKHLKDRDRITARVFSYIYFYTWTSAHMPSG